MEQAKRPDSVSRKSEKTSEDKKKRLAAALRRNLSKRKDTKEANTEDNRD